MRNHTNRRQFLTASAVLLSARHSFAASTPPKSVAAVVTVYRPNSHADVIVSKILSGWKHDGGAGPNLRLASLYVDQIPDDDMSQGLAAKHKFPIYDTIERAITLGTNRVAVDGILCIGEHGDYPWNEIGQHLYPRRRFWTEITNTLERYQRVVPVFHDKHPGPEWKDAIWMYRRAQQLKIPWMAGSSLPVSFRDPDVTVPLGSPVKAALAVGYSGLDVYGFHTLEFLQCLMERREGAETGVNAVRSFPTREIPKLLADGTINSELFDAALKSSGTNRRDVLAALPQDGAAFVVEYVDGHRVPVLMLSPHARAISVALQLPNRVVACRTEERPEPRYPHFAYLLKGIEQMFHTGRPAYPVERTLLTAGILDRALRSRHAGGQRIMTPELRVAYRLNDYSYAPHIDLSQQW